MLSIPNDTKSATKSIAEMLFKNIYPKMLSIRNKLQRYEGPLKEDEVSKLEDVFALCMSQIKKCLLALFDVFKIEHHENIILLESRQCTLDRLSWCINRLSSIELKLENTWNLEESLDDSMLVTPMYFVNWIDHTFEVLSKMAQVIYKTDYKDTEELYTQWKIDVVDCVTTLHLSLDELLLSAMTLCRYCLPSDQRIVKARCQVVLRESKALLSELISGDMDTGFKVTPDSLKLPIMPSNVNVLIDVLKDVLYVLETNTNTALLALVVHCFSCILPPVDVLKQHVLNKKNSCSCHQIKSELDVTEECSFVKDFDIYNERLLQVGSFAVSCSSDQGRILCLRSGLASLEALDPHLVPALLLSPGGRHAELLAASWRQEVEEIRDSIFLIVDPAAFAEKTKQMMHQLLLDLMKETVYNNRDVCGVINIGGVIKEFFSIYNKLEPDALSPHEKLVPLLDDLNKVVTECKVVSNLLSSGDDFVYDVKESKNDKEVALEQLTKRLKLLYTIVGRINSLLHPKENEELFDAEEVPIQNITHTFRKNLITYVKSPRKPANMSRSIFARTTIIRSSTKKFPLQKLTKHLKAKQRDELSFSIQLDEMFNLSDVKRMDKLENKQLNSVREPSILYNFSPKKRSSLRKAVLSRHCNLPFGSGLRKVDDKVENSVRSETFMDEATSLQITDILNEMSNMTEVFSKMRMGKNVTNTERTDNNCASSNVLRININTDSNASVTQHVWNIPVNASVVDIPSDDSVGAVSNMTGASNMTVPSNITTLERINDLQFLDTKINSLKTLDLETSL